MENDDKHCANVRSLTQAQIDWLKTCPHIQSFSGKRIFWTSKVLERFCEEYDKGEQATMILEKLGIDLQILGKNRVAISQLLLGDVEAAPLQPSCGKQPRAVQQE